MKLKYLFLLFLGAITVSCLSDDSADFGKNYTEENDTEIQKYITDNNLTDQVVSTESGLHFVITEEGTGDTPLPSENVTVTYKGSLTNGNTFDENTDGYTANLNRFIYGFAEGLTHVKEGGSATLLIPSRIGYGNNRLGNIPPGSVLVFDVTLVSINN